MISYKFMDISEIKEEIEDEVKEALRDISTRLYKRVVALSPVKTGRFRASWKLTADEIDSSYVTEGGTPESPLPPPRKPRMDFTKEIGVVIISNSIPYAERLENGYSQQAPAGILNVAIAELNILK